MDKGKFSLAIFSVLFLGAAVLIGYFAYPLFNPLHEKIEISAPTPKSTATPTPISKTIQLTTTPTPIKQVDSQGYYLGQISPQVPYKDLQFLEIDIHNFKPLYGQLDENDYHYGESVMDGYTFMAKKGEDFEFIAREDRSSNPASFIDTEFYGWGPTVTTGNTTIGTGIPATTRYFYVVKGTDFYGPNFVVPDGSGRTYDGSKYGRYTLTITQRK